MSVRLAIAVAVARNGVIGAGGGLAWKISDDLKWFKSVTVGKPVIMGRKTFVSIGKALPGRDNIVATRSPDFAAENVFLARSIDSAVRLGEALAKERGAEEVAVIGGGDIYAQTLPRTSRIYLTRVGADVAGDVLFPALDSADWRESGAGGCEKSEKNQYACEFVILDRRGRIPFNER